MFPWVFRLNAAGWTHLAWFGVLLPALVLRNRRKAMPATGALPDRLRHFQRTSIELVCWVVVSLSLGRAESIHLFPSAVPSLGAIAAGLVMLGAQVLYMWPRWRKAVQANARIVHLFMPSNVVERGWWMLVSVLAGVGEEITWRGVQWALLTSVIGSYVVGAAVSAVMFGAAHMTQGWRASLVIVGFALSFHLLVWVTGSLYVAMAVHVTYDIIAGLSYGRLGKQLGYTP